MRNRLALLLAFVVLAAAACAGPPEVTLAKANVPRASADPAFAKDAASAINAFGIDLYLRIATGDGNVVVSPASIAIALGMARAGALGTTATEMDAVLRDLATDDHAAWLNALDAALASRTGTFPDATNESQPVTLRTANAPFSQRGMKLVDAYLEALASRYGAGLQLVDYKTESEAARKAINAWVSDQTEKRIPELLVPGTITPDVRLTLVNAIYLKAAWLTPFAEQATKTGAFTRLDGSTVDVPLMHGGGPLPYASGDGWQAVELPYVGSSLALMVIVPDDFASFGKGLTPELLAEITGALEDRAVTLTLPKFGIESKIELAATLAAMGMPTAFEPGLADFSGITTEEQLSISAVIHQANIDVDEKGTTAAAATAIVMRGTAERVSPSPSPWTARSCSPSGTSRPAPSSSSAGSRTRPSRSKGGHPPSLSGGTRRRMRAYRRHADPPFRVPPRPRVGEPMEMTTDLVPVSALTALLERTAAELVAVSSVGWPDRPDARTT